MEKDVVKARVEEHVRTGNFFFPEDLAVAVAKELGVELAGTPFGQDPAAESKTRGDVPPFSGRPASEEFGTEESNKAVKKFDEAVAKRDVDDPNARVRITRDSLGLEQNLETEVEEEGPIFPKDDPSVPQPEGTADTASKQAPAKKGK